MTRQPLVADRPAGSERSRPDVGLLLLLLAVHAIPLAAFVAGRPWGEGLAGYAAAVVVIAGRELARELRRFPGRERS